MRVNQGRLSEEVLILKNMVENYMGNKLYDKELKRYSKELKIKS